MDKYILHGKTPIQEHDLIKWAKWFESADRIIKQTEVNDSKVSTVFLGTNHSFNGEPPMLFETMIFGGEHDSYQERCSTWAEAEEQHERAINLIFQ